MAPLTGFGCTRTGPTAGISRVPWVRRRFERLNDGVGWGDMSEDRAENESSRPREIGSDLTDGLAE